MPINPEMESAGHRPSQTCTTRVYFGSFALTRLERKREKQRQGNKMVDIHLDWCDCLGIYIHRVINASSSPARRHTVSYSYGITPPRNPKKPCWRRAREVARAGNQPVTCITQTPHTTHMLTCVEYRGEVDDKKEEDMKRRNGATCKGTADVVVQNPSLPLQPPGSLASPQLNRRVATIQHRVSIAVWRRMLLNVLLPYADRFPIPLLDPLFEVR